MNTRLASALALAALSAPLAAQDPPPPAAACFIEVPKLMAEPPAGLAELRAAIAGLDSALRPQVEEVNRLRAELDRLRQRQQQAMQDDDGTDLVALEAEIRQASAALDGGQAKLKADYAAQQKAIVGPVQARVGERAQAFGAAQGCSAMKLARPADLAALQAAGARDVTGAFVAWYGGGNS